MQAKMKFMNLMDRINRIPKPILFVVIMAAGLAFIIHQNPLQDGCEHDAKNFARDIRGILRPFETKKKGLQISLIGPQREACRDGNSPGACENYFQSLKKISEAIHRVRPECVKKVSNDTSNLIQESRSGVKTLALVAWGERPPADSTRRLGWLSQSEVYTFCRLKSLLQEQLLPEEYKAFKDGVYEEFPDAYPAETTAEQMVDMERPRALKSAANVAGTLSEDEVFQRSLFSIRCDLYY